MVNNAIIKRLLDDLQDSKTVTQEASGPSGLEQEESAPSGGVIQESSGFLVF